MTVINALPVSAATGTDFRTFVESVIDSDPNVIPVGNSELRIVGDNTETIRVQGSDFFGNNPIVTKLSLERVGTPFMEMVGFSISLAALLAAQEQSPEAIVALLGNITFNGQGGVDVAVLGAGNDALNGFGGKDILSGAAGNDVINGGAGADTMTGGRGSDTFYVDNAGDKIVEINELGTDLVYSSVTFSVVSQFVEKLTLTGTANINATGNNLVNTLLGNSGDNRLDGLLGADIMKGGAGNDTYIVDNVGDVVTDAANQGASDWVATSVSYTLGASASVEILSTTSRNATAIINLTGNAIAQTITGNAGNNYIDGKGGNDTLTGGAGHDSFDFSAALSTGNIDRITDFSVADDRIRLENGIFTELVGTGTLTSAQFYKSAAGVAHDANDHIIYDTDSGFLYYDSNGNAAGGVFHFATLAPNLALTNADFVVI